LGARAARGGGKNLVDRRTDEEKVEVSVLVDWLGQEMAVADSPAYPTSVVWKPLSANDFA
jgi:hypothetical protein